MQPGVGRRRGRPAGCAAGGKQQHSQQVPSVAQRTPALSARCLGRLLNAVIEDGVFRDPPVRTLPHPLRVCQLFWVPA